MERHERPGTLQVDFVSKRPSNGVSAAGDGQPI